MRLLIVQMSLLGYSLPKHVSSTELNWISNCEMIKGSDHKILNATLVLLHSIKVLEKTNEDLTPGAYFQGPVASIFYKIFHLYQAIAYSLVCILHKED